jgi:alpha-L-rhamnosidase
MTSRFGRAVRSCRGTLLSLPCQIALGLGIASGVGSASMLPAELQCEYRVEPLGVDSPGPRLGWVLRPVDPAARGLTQTAYRILVASSPELLGKDRGDLWDSGKVASDRTNAVAYAGKPLRSNQAVVWKVRVWDGADTPCPWSAPASWTAGVFGPADWHAKWISAPESLKGNDNSTVLVRHEFAAKPGLKRATVNVCGLGQYEMTLNGGNVTKDVFTPGWTEYTKTCLYDTYDVTGLLREGKNAVGLLLGNGMYRVAKGGRYAKFQRSFGRLQAIAQIHLEYSDGTTDVVGTDERWRAGPSPMTFSSVYGGEDWDARLEQKGWDRADFDGSKWSPVDTLAGPGGALKGVGRGAPPVRAFEVHRPVGEKSVKPNVAIYDLGQNASHVTRFTVSGPAGSAVRVTPSELLTETGVLFRNNYNGRAFSQYTLTGTGKETYTAKFYYCGCRYLQVECLPADGGS